MAGGSLADLNYRRCVGSSARRMIAITFDAPSQFPQRRCSRQPSVDAFLKLRPEEVDALLKFLQAL